MRAKTFEVDLSLWNIFSFFPNFQPNQARNWRREYGQRMLEKEKERQSHEKNLSRLPFKLNWARFLKFPTSSGSSYSKIIVLSPSPSSCLLSLLFLCYFKPTAVQLEDSQIRPFTNTRRKSRNWKGEKVRKEEKRERKRRETGNTIEIKRLQHFPLANFLWKRSERIVGEVDFLAKKVIEKNHTDFKAITNLKFFPFYNDINRKVWDLIVLQKECLCKDYSEAHSHCQGNKTYHKIRPHSRFRADLLDFVPIQKDFLNIIRLQNTQNTTKRAN